MDNNDDQEALVGKEEEVGVRYNQAIEMTLNKERGCLNCGSCGTFQFLLVCVFLIVANTYDPEIFGLGFLEVEPKKFECKSDDEWKECTKEDICEQSLDQDHYRAAEIKSDDIWDETIDNWVSPDKFNLLCEPKWKVGLLGSFFFIGVVATMLVIPPLSDAYGRRVLFLIVLLISIIAQFGLLVTKSIYEAYIFQFLNGATFTGKVVVGLNYLIEFSVGENQKRACTLFYISEAVSLILITMWYQFVDRHWFLLQLILLILLILAAIYYLAFVKESPKWLYTWKKYDESREVLQYVAKFNANSEQKIEAIRKSKFDTEVLEDQEEMSKRSKSSHHVDDMPQSQYIKNICKMTVFWTASSFSFYMLQGMTKQFEGSLYLNYYLDAVAGIIACIIAPFLYNWVKMKIAFITSISITLVFGILLLLFQEQVFSSQWVGGDSGFPEGSKQDQNYHLSILVPIIVFITKVGINLTFVFAYLASFNESCIYPFYKRATAIGYNNFIARSVTIASPLVAELDRPIPGLVLIFVQLIAFATAFFLPSKQDQSDFDANVENLSAKSSKGGAKRD